MPREHDPEWMWRARIWAASWKTIVLVVSAVAFSVFCYVWFDYNAASFFIGAMCLFVPAVVLWFRA